MGQSTISVEKELSNDLDIYLKGSQFIDYLQNYIEELNGAIDRKTIKGKGSNENSYNDDVNDEMKNFKKNKGREHTNQPIDSQRS